MSKNILIVLHNLSTLNRYFFNLKRVFFNLGKEYELIDFLSFLKKYERNLYDSYFNYIQSHEIKILDLKNEEINNLLVEYFRNANFFVFEKIKDMYFVSVVSAIKDYNIVKKHLTEVDKYYVFIIKNRKGFVEKFLVVITNYSEKEIFNIMYNRFNDFGFIVFDSFDEVINYYKERLINQLKYSIYTNDCEFFFIEFEEFVSDSIC